MKKRIASSLALACCLAVLSMARPAEIHGGHGITLAPPPPTEAKPVTDTINGVVITDPYRWLEDAKSPQTRAWIEAQMRYTEEYLSQVKNRPAIVKRLTELERVETFTVPRERNGNYFFTKRQPEENQSSIYVRRGLHGQDERLVDANTLSTDQNTSVRIEDVSENGDLLVYSVREGGADEKTVHLLDVNKHQELPDVLPKARYSQVSLSPDNHAVYYSRFEPTGTLVFFHRLGSPVASDQLIFGKEFNGETLGPMELIDAGVTENKRYLLITVSHGVPPKRVDIYAKDLHVPDAPIRPIIHGIDNRFEAINYQDDLYVLTDYRAEKYRVLKVSIADPSQAHWQTVVPESGDVISDVSIVGDRLFATGLHDVVTRTRIFTMDGQAAGTITYPGLGSASAVLGRAAAKEGFYSFESFNFPRTIYHYDVTSGKSDVFAQPKVPFSSDQYEVKQLFYQSKDGTRIPMFVSSRKQLKRDATIPTLMFAYGGFNISLTPQWDPEYAWWMEQGGYYAQPNLRGGGEYGEAWHEAGMFEKKQNVFDDFYSAAEYLIDNKYTAPAHLAIRGRSNGGLLMGAAMTQRPDLFGAIWCGYPLTDMLRFQKFLVGRWWTAEYGSADNPEQFAYLLKYSPYQNVKPGTKYPAIMFNSGDSDTRVDPLHARKMAAIMQADSGSDRPILLHYETKAGHSAGVSIAQLVNDVADELAFLWNEVSSK
ncbi:MAG TPA: prolyl oligopeptidase family serine peptidase [Terriglobales bacterium]|nr:prolyl oligopeptidase family serine peptidase [Terriglobales bacterium]